MVGWTTRTFLPCTDGYYRTARSGHPGQDRIAMTGQPGPDSKNRKARAQDCKDKMSYIYRSGQDRRASIGCQERTIRRGQSGQERHEITARKANQETIARI
jgi:hypothetical protein